MQAGQSLHLGKSKEFGGSYVTFKGLKAHGLKLFSDMKLAWEDGTDFTWLCTLCHSVQGSQKAGQEFARHTLGCRQAGSSAWSGSFSEVVAGTAKKKRGNEI